MVKISTSVRRIIGIGFVLAYPSWMAIASEVAPDEIRGQVIGAIGMAEGIDAIFGVVLGPLLYISPWAAIRPLGISQENTPFYLSALLLTISTVLSATWVQRRRRGQR
ncbi:MAG TPA: MFS transporter [Armatimonadota bacterium]|jgi:MFS family permease